MDVNQNSSKPINRPSALGTHPASIWLKAPTHRHTATSLYASLPLLLLLVSTVTCHQQSKAEPGGSCVSRAASNAASGSTVLFRRATERFAASLICTSTRQEFRLLQIHRVCLLLCRHQSISHVQGRKRLMLARGLSAHQPIGYEHGRYFAAGLTSLAVLPNKPAARLT